MAQRRMFSLKIIDTDLFLDMPLSTQALYFHLSLRADDDGFIGNHKKIMRMIGATEDDMRILIAKQLIIPFESGVCVIKHWRIHNYIQKDRYNPTFYKYEKSMLIEVDNTYEKLEQTELETECIQDVHSMDTECIQDVHEPDTQVRLELGKDRLEIEIDNVSKDTSVNKFTPIIDKWNSLNLQQLRTISNNRQVMLNARIKEHGFDSVLEAIENIEKSSFLKGQNNKNWVIKFDWFIKPNNFVKVLENNYIDSADKQNVVSKEQNYTPKKNKFHNFNETFQKYSPDELDEIIMKSQREKFK